MTDRWGVTTDECSEATVRKAGVMDRTVNLVDRTHQNLWIPFKGTVWWALSMDVWALATERGAISPDIYAVATDRTGKAWIEHPNLRIPFKATV